MTDTISVAEYDDRLAKAMPERELQENVRAACKKLGYLYYHTHRSQHSPAGFPDCTIITTDRRLIFAELKKQDKEPTSAQKEWLEALDLIAEEVVGNRMSTWPIEVYVWRPANWISGEIEAILTGKD